MPATICHELYTPGHTTVCPRSSDPFYIVTYYIKWVTDSWTDGTYISGRLGFSVSIVNGGNNLYVILLAFYSKFDDSCVVPLSLMRVK